MTQARRWIHDQEPFEVRYAAREAARREGKTLGEWLQDVIADYAFDCGQLEDSLTEDDRADAVALRLDQLRTRKAVFDPRPAPESRQWPARREDFGDDRRIEPYGSRPSDRTRRGVSEISAENRLLDRASDLLTPDRRQDARYTQREEIGSRFQRQPPSSARGERHASKSAPAQSDESYRHLDQKLDSILQAMQTQSSEPQPIEAAPEQDRRLGQAIADVVRRQRTLNIAEIKPVAPRVPLRRRGAPHDGAMPIDLPAKATPTAPSPPARQADPPSRKSRLGIEIELAALCSEIAGTLRGHKERMGGVTNASHSGSAPTPSHVPDELIVLAPDEVAAVETPAPPASVSTPQPQPCVVQQPVVQISAPMPQAPSAAESVALVAIGTLQQQVADLSKRFDKTDTTTEAYRTKLDAIDQQLLQLATDHAITAGRFAATAAAAAREAVETVMHDGRFATLEAASRDVLASRDRQDASEIRTMSALDAVRETLEKVADRLISVEDGMISMATTRTAAAAVRGDPVAAVSPDPSPAPAPSIVSEAAASPPKLSVLKPPVPKPTVTERPVLAARRDASHETRVEYLALERDFIAQARQSATAVRKPAVDVRRPLVQPPAPAPHTGFTQQAQRYLTRYRRPIGIGLAATCVIAGLTEIVNVSGVGPGDTVAIASARFNPPLPSAVKTAQAAPPHETHVVAKDVARQNSMAFGLDPLQTASFTKTTITQPAPPMLAQPGSSLAETGPAAYAQGVAFADGRDGPRDFGRAAQAFERAADLGIVPARLRLASLYEKGLGVARDREKAKALYTTAAEAGNPHAMHNLAVMLTDGAGHPDYESAATWFRRAAQFGLRDSQFNLGVLYAEGIGVERSYLEAYQWFAIAAAQGDAGALTKRDIVATKLTQSDLMVAKAIADSFHPRRVDPLAVGAPPPNQAGTNHV